jgi:hypothetical protein
MRYWKHCVLRRLGRLLLVRRPLTPHTHLPNHSCLRVSRSLRFPRTTEATATVLIQGILHHRNSPPSLCYCHSYNRPRCPIFSPQLWNRCLRLLTRDFRAHSRPRRTHTFLPFLNFLNHNLLSISRIDKRTFVPLLSSNP